MAAADELLHLEELGRALRRHIAHVRGRVEAAEPGSDEFAHAAADLEHLTREYSLLRAEFAVALSVSRDRGDPALGLNRRDQPESDAG